MRLLPRRAQLALLLRSFSVQGSWNYETLIGTGFAFTLLPGFRSLYGNDPKALREVVARHAEVFNCHPYLATVAIGALLRLEADGVDPRVIERLKGALRGSLGSLGDQLIWGAWRPASVLAGLALILAGAPWWLGIAVFLTLYNGLHLALRVWGLWIGANAGLEIGKALREAPLQALARRAADAGALICGFAVVLAIAPTRPDPLQAILSLLAVGLGLWLGLRMRRFMGMLVGLAWILAIIFGLIV